MSFDYNVADLQKAYDKAKENTFEQLYGTFRVKVDKIELGKTKTDPVRPVGNIQFRIIDGPHKKKCLFYSQILVTNKKDTGELTAFGIKIFDDFLTSLKPSFVVSFKDCKDGFKEDKPDNYQNLLLDVAEDIAQVEYDIQVTKNTVNGKDYPQYKIIEVYE